MNLAEANRKVRGILDEVDIKHFRYQGGATAQPLPISAGAFFIPKRGSLWEAVGDKWRRVVEKGGKWSKVGD